MLCSQCQFDLGDDAPGQCPRCGQPVSLVEAGETAQSSEISEERRQSRAMLWTLLVIGCAAIGIALFGLFWALKQKPPHLVDTLGADPVPAVMPEGVASGVSAPTSVTP
jgi:uncharacterized membrane protein YvbJ